jgi:polyadenylate-binding protein
LANVFHSIEDDSALRAKVDEALTVYDEYVKNSKGDEASGEAPAAPAAEEPKEAKKEESA